MYLGKRTRKKNFRSTTASLLSQLITSYSGWSNNKCSRSFLILEDSSRQNIFYLKLKNRRHRLNAIYKLSKPDLFRRPTISLRPFTFVNVFLKKFPMLHYDCV
jgi:hypothetical protein